MPNLSKVDLEKRILEKYRTIDYAKPNNAWLYDQPFKEFLTAWHELVYYYEREQDQAISIAVLDTYLDQTTILRHIWEDEKILREQRQDARIALRNLEAAMNSIKQAVLIYNPEDEDNP